MPIDYVHTTGSAVGGSPAPSVVVTVTTAASAGNTLVLVVKGSTTFIASSASDTRGNTYTVDKTNAASPNSISVVRAYLTTGLLVNDTVTVNMSGSGNVPTAVAYEYRGMLVPAAGTVLDSSNAAGGNGIVQLATGNVTVNDALDVLLACLTINTASAVTVPTNYTDRGGTTGGGVTVDLAELLPGATGTFAATWKWVTSGNAAVALMAYRPAYYRLASQGSG